MTAIGLRSFQKVFPFFSRIFARATRHGYASLTALTFVDGLGLPVPAELSVWALVTLVRREQVRLWPAILAASFGNTGGSLVPVMLGRYGLSRWLQRLLPTKESARRRLERRITGYGVFCVIISRVTGIMRVATIVTAGILRMPLHLLVPSLYVGAVIWLYLGYTLVSQVGMRSHRIRASFSGRLVDIGIVLLFAAIAVGVYAYFRYRKRQAEESDS